MCAFSLGLISLLVLTAAPARAHPHNGTQPGHSHDNANVHENGIGADPDNDSNPATDTSTILFYTDAKLAADDPRFKVITFEPPPGKHGEAIRKDYEQNYGVSFGRGLSWQICKGQRHFQYDSMCTYEAPASGLYSAGYLHYLNAPLIINFQEPVCVVTVSVYPTGAKQGEPFEFKIEGWAPGGGAVPGASMEFEWTKDTVRWRNMAGAYFRGAKVNKIALTMRSKDAAEAKETLRFLIDDLAYLRDDCANAGPEIVEQATASGQSGE